MLSSAAAAGFDVTHPRLASSSLELLCLSGSRALASPVLACPALHTLQMQNCKDLDAAALAKLQHVEIWAEGALGDVHEAGTTAIADPVTATKRKLALKDQIARIEDELFPDIIA